MIPVGGVFLFIQKIKMGTAILAAAARATSVYKTYTNMGLHTLRNQVTKTFYTKNGNSPIIFLMPDYLEILLICVNFNATSSQLFKKLRQKSSLHYGHKK